MINLNPQVDLFLAKTNKWREEMTLLRTMVQQCNLDEAYKWMHPCYTFQGKNIVLIHGFKDYCALLFFKGVLLKDEHRILIQQTQNVQDRRQIRFTSAEEIMKLQETIKAYILEAVGLEKAGARVEFKETRAFTMPDEFRSLLTTVPELKRAFEGLTPGRQRGYLLYFSAPKQQKTREARIEKYREQILAGKGLED